ncbi:MAG: ATP-binding protein, partial [Lentisphaeria bacterium]|nr:ATP-binding protein [Lentisphaeria bacterium]
MIDVLAVTNFRSILDLQVPLGSLNLVTGANGVGKSNLYRSLHLLSACAQGGIVNSLARDGGFCSTYWAGPPVISRAMKNGTVPIQGVRTTKPKRLKLGFSCEDLSYAISLGLRPADPCDPTLFKLDPDIKRECIWAGPICKPSAMLVDRRGVLVQTRNESGVWDIID